MYITKKIREDIFKDNGASEKDTGSTEGQIALFTTKINHLTKHLKKNKKRPQPKGWGLRKAVTYSPT